MFAIGAWFALSPAKAHAAQDAKLQARREKLMNEVVALERKRRSKPLSDADEARLQRVTADLERIIAELDRVPLLERSARPPSRGAHGATGSVSDLQSPDSHGRRPALRAAKGVVADQLHLRRGRDRRAARPERRRQVHAPQYPGDAARAVARPRRIRRRMTADAGAAAARADRHARPRSVSLSRVDRAREPRRSSGTVRRCADVARRGRIGARSRRISPTVPTIRSAAFRAACASASPSSARSFTIRN